MKDVSLYFQPVYMSQEERIKRLIEWDEQEKTRGFSWKTKEVKIPKVKYTGGFINFMIGLLP